MTHEDFNSIVENEIEKAWDTLSTKGDEYNQSEDRLLQFKTAASLQSCTPQQALGGMMAKHVIALFDFIAREETDMDRWDEKIGDIHNYLYLLAALLEEEWIKEWKR